MSKKKYKKYPTGDDIGGPILIVLIIAVVLIPIFMLGFGICTCHCY